MGYNRTLGHFTNSQELATIWASGQNYIVDQLILNNDILYRCNTAHTSGATFSGDSAYWTGINPGSTITIAQGGTGQTTKTEAFDALSPTTTAGDLIVYNGTDNVRLPVGSDGQAIVADATSPNKLKWGNVAITSGGTGQNNKTDAFDALAPTTTAGDLIVYNGTDNVRLPVGTDGQMIIADSSQTNKLKWANVPQGSKNYITFSNFENNATTGWSLFNTTLTSKIPTGSITAGAASLNALAVTASTPLAGLYSLIVTSPAAVSAGQGFITDALPIDREDQAKVLTFSFYYEVISGVSNMNFSGTSSNTWAVYIAEVNPATPDTVINWIQPAGVYGMTQSTGTGLVTGTFQTSSTGAAYRVAVVCVTASAGAISMEFDDFKLGPQTAPIGPVVTDWVSYTPTFTGFGTVTTQTFWWRRVGDSLEVKGRFVSGASTATEARISIPFTSADSSRINGAFELAGRIQINAQSTTFFSGGSVLIEPSVTYLTIGTESSTSNGMTKTNGNNFASITRELSLFARVPIQGWSSNVQLSNDTDTRVVAFFATNTGGSTTAIPTGSAGTKIVNLTSQIDTHGTWNSSTQAYTIPVSGIYDITTSIYVGSINNGINVGVFIDGVYNEFSSQLGTISTVSSNRTRYFNAGTTVSLGTYQTTGSTQNYGNFNPTFLKIQRLSGPSVIAATENVIAKYSTTAGQAITSTPATVVYATREIDSHGIVNTINGDITIPISGKYLIGVYGSTASATWASGQQFLWQIRKNGSFSSFINQIRAQAAYTGILESVGPTYIDCLAGDVINIQAQSSVATTLRTAAGTNFFYLVRLGN